MATLAHSAQGIKSGAVLDMPRGLTSLSGVRRRAFWLINCFLALSLGPSLAAQNFGWTGTNSLAMPVPREHLLRILTPSVLAITLVTTRTNENAPVEQWDFVHENFELTLPGASDFRVLAGATEIPVKQMGFRRRPLYAPLKHRDLRILDELYLILATEIPARGKVQVLNPSGKLWPAEWQLEARNDPGRFSPVIHVNQIGYQYRFPKVAVVGYYLGNLGELELSRELEFSLIDQSSETVQFKGKLRPRKDKGFSSNPTPYQNVWEADFSPFDRPGWYRLEVQGVGASLPFQIDDGTLATFARTYALGLYHQRCGTSNALPFTRFIHEACHTNFAEIPDETFKRAQRIIEEVTSDAKTEPRHTAPQLKNTAASLYPFVRQGKIDVTGGHHDAGDYSKYTINSAGLIHALVFAADSFAGAGALDNLGLPESGDGKSDLLQEAKWEADFLVKMQDNDGGFFFLVYPKERQYEDNVLPDKGDAQIVWPKNTSATAAATAALAEIGSSPLFKKQFPESADLYLRKALRGWAFLERALGQYGADGSYQKLTHYGHEFWHDDELAWAAAALFAATGNRQFEQRFVNAFKPEDSGTRRWSWWPMFEGWGNATRSYAFAVRSGRLSAGQVDQMFVHRCEQLIRETAANHVRWATESAYGTSFPDPNKSNLNAGWYFSSERAFDITVAYQLGPDEGLRAAVVSNLNYEAGCNPVNVTYITGLGMRRQREIVHQYAQNDYRVLPPSGIPLGNIQSGFAYLDPYKKELGALAYPPDGAKSGPYPFYDRWGDSFNTTTEFVIVDEARSLASLAFWMAQTPLKEQSWRSADARIASVPARMAVGEKVRAQLEVNGLEPKEAKIVWEARDQEPIIGKEFIFAPKNVGEQWIEAEAIWPDGRRAFAKTNFSAAAGLNTPPNPFRSAKLPLTDEVAVLYDLDGTGKDQTGRSGELTFKGDVSFDVSNLSWMRDRAGAALRFKDIGDAASVSVDLAKIAPARGEITLEAMIYINAFKAYNRTNAKILSLSEDWNSSLEFVENMYEGPMVRGGTKLSLKKERIASSLTLTNWHHLALTISPVGYRVRVDGKEIASVKADELENWGRKPALLEFGNFDGYIDEVALICKTEREEDAATTPDGGPKEK